MYRPIGDYGAIGNLRTVALVSRAGSIDGGEREFLLENADALRVSYQPYDWRLNRASDLVLPGRGLPPEALPEVGVGAAR